MRISDLVSLLCIAGIWLGPAILLFLLAKGYVSLHWPIKFHFGRFRDIKQPAALKPKVYDH